MPAMLTHCIYGDKAIASSNSDYLRRIINRNLNVFHLGCQGPDLLLFYHRMPWQKTGKEIVKLGTRIHSDSPRPLFDYLFECVKNSNNNETVISYVCGFLAHHGLDSIVHPYVYYCTGSTNKDIGKDHELFESEIDRGVLDLLKLDLKDYIPYKILKVNNKERDIVAEILNDYLNKQYQIGSTKETMKECYKDIIKVEKIIFSKGQRKYDFLAWLEKKLKADGLATSMMIPFTYDNKIDALNYRRDKWCNPCDDKVISYDSFEMMAEKALKRIKNNLSAFDEFIHKKISKQDLLKTIGNYSFETGCEGIREMKYFRKDLKK